MNTAQLDTLCLDSERLNVYSWNRQKNRLLTKPDFTHQVSEVLTPAVLASLPEHWQSVSGRCDALDWIVRRASESSLFVVENKATKQLIGFLLLHELPSSASQKEVRVGYLIRQSCWGKGYASELIAALVLWCEKQKFVKKLSAGAERENIGSIRVLEKNGFELAQLHAEDPSTIFLERAVGETKRDKC